MTTPGHALTGLEKLTGHTAGNNGMHRATCECGWARKGTAYTCRRLHGRHAATEKTEPEHRA